MSPRSQHGPRATRGCAPPGCGEVTPQAWARRSTVRCSGSTGAAMGPAHGGRRPLPARRTRGWEAPSGSPQVWNESALCRSNFSCAPCGVGTTVAGPLSRTVTSAHTSGHGEAVLRTRPHGRRPASGPDEPPLTGRVLFRDPIKRLWGGGQKQMGLTVGLTLKGS